MKAIKETRFDQRINALPPSVIQQPKDTTSFSSNILTVRNSVNNPNKSQCAPQYMNVNTGLTRNQEAPPRPPQPEMALKLRMAVKDFEQDPDMARAKWNVSKRTPEQHTGLTNNGVAPLKTAKCGVESALKFLITLKDFEQDQGMALKKSEVSKSTPE